MLTIINNWFTLRWLGERNEPSSGGIVEVIKAQQEGEFASTPFQTPFCLRYKYILVPILPDGNCITTSGSLHYVISSA
mgnify:CR=1 FL=1